MLTKTLLHEDVTKYINVNYPIYSFDIDACEKDVKHYIDAFKYDLL